MNLLKITYLLIVSFAASFSIRVIGTLFPAIFHDSYVVRITIFIHAFSMLLQLLFFIFFLISFAKTRALALKVVSFLTILGSLTVSLIYIKNFGIAFDIEILQMFIINKYLHASIPLVNSISQLLFFAVFKSKLTDDEQINLARPILAAIIGVGTFFFLHLIGLLKLIKIPIFTWLEQIPRLVAVYTFPLMGLAAVLLLYFYISFYQYISSLNTKKQE